MMGLKSKKKENKENLPVVVDKDKTAVVNKNQTSLAKNKESTALTSESTRSVVYSDGVCTSSNPLSTKVRKERAADADFDYGDFPNLARLMNVSLEQLKDEFFLFQIRKLMSKIGKVMIRYNVSESEIEKLFLNARALELNQILVSPVYLAACERQVKKHKLHDVQVGTIIDFPFGESSFKSKLANVRDCIKTGVDQITVTIPNALNDQSTIKVFKKQIRKVGRSFKQNSGVAFNATDLSEEQIKRAMKITGKSKLSFVVFAFGEATLEELKAKMNVVNKYKGNKKVCVLANVDRAEPVMELFKLDVDRILTPFADSIGEELVKRFRIKSVKLV